MMVGLQFDASARPEAVYQTRDTYAEINLMSIRRNIRYIKQQLPIKTELMAVVKANGYGHGAVEVARAALQAGADSLAVAYLSEAIELRNSGLSVPILVLTPIAPEEAIRAARRNLMMTVPSAAWLKEVRAMSSGLVKLKLHIKLDTGLGRIGIREREEWEELAPMLQAADIRVEGVYTHFATAGRQDSHYMKEQLARFYEMKGWIAASGIKVGRYHCAGSSAALRFPELAMDMVRIGAAMYGFTPQLLSGKLSLEQALSLHSRLVHVKKVEEGASIGYDLDYHSPHEEWIGTVPIGYADGWNQSLRHMEVLIGGERAPIVGKICMDQLMIRLPGYLPVGTQVTLIGQQGSEYISCSELAVCLGGAAQEVSTLLSSRVPRAYHS